LKKLLTDIDELDRIVARNQERFRAICRERGLDFDKLSEEERMELIDRILHGE